MLTSRKVKLKHLLDDKRVNEKYIGMPQTEDNVKT